MNFSRLISIISRIHIEFPRVRYVVFSGGEPTLLKNDLLNAIKYLTNLGLGSRVVTNGGWAKSESITQKWISRFSYAGLGELNFSTGDEHQVYVPFDYVARAAYHSVNHGILALIVVEGRQNAGFNMSQLIRHPLIKKILTSPRLKRRLILMKNVWMPFHKKTDILNNEVPFKYEGCNNLFDNLVITPYGELSSCCGLTMNYIPEFRIGSVDENDLRSVYQKQYYDLLKLWLWLDGPAYIFKELSKQPKFRLKIVSPHACAICAQIYKNPSSRILVTQLINKKIDEIIFRASIKLKYRQLH
ncbi:MAG: SPASM domain-containing protein [Candidatus Omnitrophota bacterium]